MSVAVSNPNFLDFPLRNSARSYVSDVCLFACFLLLLGVLDPQLDVVNFDTLTVQMSVSETSQASPYNQFRWIALAAVMSLPMLWNPTNFFRASLQNWPVILLLGFCLLSSVWSEHEEVSVRRAMGLIIPAYCLLAAVTYIDHLGRAVQVAYLAFWAALVLNLAVLYLPVAFDEFGFFRGATGNKNQLGALAAVAILVGISVRNWLQTYWSRVARVLYLLAWSGLLIISVSKTSIVLALLIPTIFLGLRALSNSLRLDLMLTTLGTVAFFLVLLAIFYYGAGVTASNVVQLFWSDSSFTGRTPIWNFMINAIGQNWIVGIGFGSFWGIGYNALNLRSVYDYIQLLNQAHNGYLDLLAAIGISGFGLLMLMLIRFSRSAEALRFKNPDLFKFSWMIVLFSLIYNFMESSFIMPFDFLWNLTLFAIFITGRAAAEEEYV